MIEIINSFVTRNTGHQFNNKLLTMNVYDAGLDSLLLVGLIVELEAKSGKILPEDKLERLISGDFTFEEIINAFSE
ncbi:phosphopantetheine-binding protein [Erwinia oleae]|uniref:phosphopantetheine-binding protein n=1 Tax=Erwinia oleae TaxID=796334 RepID=UPI0005585488|nr:phosphopantetheine-binding protein [Erwinia oleae]